MLFDTRKVNCKGKCDCDENENWLIQKSSLDKIDNPDYNHAYILPDNSIFVLDSDGTNLININEVNDKYKKFLSRLEFVYNSNYFTRQCNLVAHRGLMDLAPENSRISFELAGKMGFWGIETDCHETKDGKFYLYHDANLSSQTTGEGKITELNSEQLKNIVYSRGQSSLNYPNTPLATLNDYLEIASRYKMFCILEIGEIKNIQGLLKIIYSYNMENSVLIFSNQYSLNSVRKLDNNIPIGLVTWKKITNTDIDFCVNKGINMLGIAVSDGSTKINMNENIVKYAHENNILINAYIVNSSVEYNWCLSNHVDIITTDKYRRIK